MVEVPSDGECKIPVDAAFLEEVRYGVINLGELRSSGEMQQGDVLRVRVVVADRDVVDDLAQPLLGSPSAARDRAQQLAVGQEAGSE